MPIRRLILTAATAAIALASAATVGATPTWHELHRSDLQVTSGSIIAAKLSGHPAMRTRSAEMRAVQRAATQPATTARLAFRFLGNSSTTKPLGSGLVRRQIGLKLRAHDPCNLLYVMWHRYPDHAIEIQIKRNPGQTTSSQCGNRGYSRVALLPLGPVTGGTHTLEARTRRTSTGALALSVYTDGSLLDRETLPASTTAGLSGPIGIRSDNGDYVFRLFGSPHS